MNNSLINENTSVVGFKIDSEVKDLNKVFESIKYFYLGNKNKDQIIIIYYEDYNKASSYFKDISSYDLKIGDKNHESNLVPDILFEIGKELNKINLNSIYLYKNDNNVSFLYPFEINKFNDEDTYKDFLVSFNGIKSSLINKKMPLSISYLSNTFEKEEELLKIMEGKKEIIKSFKGFIKIKDLFTSNSSLILINPLTFEVILETYQTFFSYLNEKKKEITASQYFAKMAIQFQKSKDIDLNNIFLDVNISFIDDEIVIHLNENLELSSLIFIYKYLNDFFY